MNRYPERGLHAKIVLDLANDIVTERLIELLKKLETDTAIAAVAVIVRRFGDANWLPAAKRKKAA